MKSRVFVFVQVSVKGGTLGLRVSPSYFSKQERNVIEVTWRYEERTNSDLAA